MTDFGIQLEHAALDKIHRVLRMTRFKPGATARQIADETGLAVGYVEGILKKSVCVLKRRPRNPELWFADWEDIEPAFRPQFPRGRPEGYSQRTGRAFPVAEAGQACFT